MIEGGVVDVVEIDDTDGVTHTISVTIERGGGGSVVVIKTTTVVGGACGCIVTIESWVSTEEIVDEPLVISLGLLDALMVEEVKVSAWPRMMVMPSDDVSLLSSVVWIVEVVVAVEALLAKVVESRELVYGGSSPSDAVAVDDGDIEDWSADAVEVTTADSETRH